MSVVIPMMNEARNLPHVLERVDRAYELILVDGNSSDSSVDVARALRPDAKVILQTRCGKGNALAEGVAASNGHIVVLLDADGSTDPEEIPLFVRALTDGAGFAKGSRMIGYGGSEDITGFRRLGNTALTRVANFLFGVRYTDINYGFNGTWRKNWQLLGIDYDGFEVEALMSVRAAKAGLDVVEVPSYESSRIHGRSNLNAFRDGWRILKMLIREKMAWRSHITSTEQYSPVSEEAAPAPVSVRQGTFVGAPQRRYMSGYLALEDGVVFPGTSIAASGVAVGEAVFATAMTGYQELVTDPSYAEQIICFSASMVGNYGVDSRRSESSLPHARAVVMRETGSTEWVDWLKAHGVVALSGVDTRSVVLHLRDQGSLRAIVATGDLSPAEAIDRARSLPAMEGRSLVKSVSTSASYVFADGDVRIGVVDYGCKRSILRQIAAAGAAVTVLPHDASAEELARFDGVVLSNGPGDPGVLDQETTTVRELLGRTPILGVCLGHQLLGRAAGLHTYKLPCGHRGANHPVLYRRQGRVLVTSQNHGFAVAATDESEAIAVSLYDGSVEALDYPNLRAQSVQFHPEGGPGPHDGRSIIDTWIERVRAKTI